MTLQPGDLLAITRPAGPAAGAYQLAGAGLARAEAVVGGSAAGGDARAAGHHAGALAGDRAGLQRAGGGDGGA